MKNFAYIPVASVEAAVRQLGASSLALAGGTDIINLMKDRVLEPDALVNVKGIAGLAAIETTATGAVIGANARLTDILAHDGLRRLYPALIEALHDVGTPQIRNMSTIGGNLCARPRCWYFRRDGFNCLKRGGSGCSAFDGDNELHAIFATGERCVMVHPSSAAPALVALGATLRVSGPAGARTVDAEKFFTLPSADMMRENVLGPSDVLTHVELPAPAGPNATYEVRHKESHDWPLALASVALSVQGANVAAARICLGAVAPVPWRAGAAEAALRGKPLSALDGDLARTAAAAAVEGARPLSQNRFKVQIARVAVERAIVAAATGRRV